MDDDGASAAGGAGLRQRLRKPNADDSTRSSDTADAAARRVPAAADHDRSAEGDSGYDSRGGDDSGGECATSIGRMEDHCIVLNTSSLVCVLESYRGRDKAIRLLHYALLLFAGLCPDEQTSEALESLSISLGSARVVLRLFDDLSVLRSTVAYGWGQQEGDWYARILTLIENASGQLFYPLEHIAFILDSRILGFDAQPWWILSLFAWGLALLCSVLRSSRAFVRLCGPAAAERKKATHRTDDDTQSSHSHDGGQANGGGLPLTRQMQVESVVAVKDGADLTTVVHWLIEAMVPGSGGCLPMAAVGGLGTVSSLAGIWLAATGESISPGDS